MVLQRAPAQVAVTANLATARAPPPFSPQESKELLGVLNSRVLSVGGGDSGVEGQNAVQVRVVARVLRRVVQWKQHFFRPEKPLPVGTVPHSHSHSSQHQHAYGTVAHRHGTGSGAHRRTALDVVLAWVCLGIPYLYANRHMYSGLGRFDEEGGLMRSVGPLVVVGVGICVVVRCLPSRSLSFPLLT